MEEKIDTIKKWLGYGSINIFGLPMSGKDTQGVKLAETLNAKFLSSGMIIRAMEKETENNYSENGNLIPTNLFYEWVLPYLERKDLFETPLILSSIGRWFGEENQVMSIASGAGHDIKAVISLDIPENEVINRFNTAKTLNDRGDRKDDDNLEIMKTRLKEYREKTIPVLRHYEDLGLLIKVNGNQSREDVFNEIVEKLYEKASESLS
ncbi:nucleoside monophosphate kinase [Candidatus Saccharibacteria bacterium]|nr:nucleoside monophosphate kinase [Candidatus Saccharibacteria bacterium]